MRRSRPTPRRTSSTSLPSASHRLAISLISEMRAASMALAAYLVISALSGLMNRIGLPVRTNGSVELLHEGAGARRRDADDDAVGLQEVLDRGAFLEELRIGDDVELVARAGARSSRRRAPRCRPGRCSCRRRPGSRPRPRRASIASPIAAATAITADRSASPFAPSGVPTAMKQISDRRTASARSVVKVSRRCATLRLISSSSPGS